MEQVAYFIKQRWPSFFGLIELLARTLTVWRFGRRVHVAEEVARMTGVVDGRGAEIRALRAQDSAMLYQFLAELPADWLEHFQPHAFDHDGLVAVLGSRAFMNYGVFIDGKLVGYALLKVAPTGSAFIGLLVHPALSGLGLGRFIVAYLYWQASVAGLRARSTISKSNVASLRSHQAVAGYKVVADLPNNYIMIEFPNAVRQQPELQLP